MQELVRSIFSDLRIYRDKDKKNYTARPQLQIRILYMIYNMRARYVYLLKNRNLNYKADRRMYIAF